MSSNKIYIHIGYPKTATTFLQTKYFDNLPSFSYLGKNYNNENNLIYKIFTDFVFNKPTVKKSQIVYARKTILEYLQTGNVLISNEDFLFNSLRFSDVSINFSQSFICRRIKAFFIENITDINIFFTVRNQVSILPSIYSQSYVHFFSYSKKNNTFVKFLSNIILQKSKIKNDKNIEVFISSLNYNEVYNIYVDVFGEDNVDVFVFEELLNSPDSFFKKTSKYFQINNTFSITNEKINVRGVNKHERKIRSFTLYDFLYRLKSVFFGKLVVNNKLKKILSFLKYLKLRKSKMTNEINLDKNSIKEIKNIFSNNNKKLSEKKGLKLYRYKYY